MVWADSLVTVFYDHSAAAAGTHEEETGLATSFDNGDFGRIGERGPSLTCAHAPWSLRYVGAVQVGDDVYYYHEYTRTDGSYELRLSRARM